VCLWYPLVQKTKKLPSFPNGIFQKMDGPSAMKTVPFFGHGFSHKRDNKLYLKLYIRIIVLLIHRLMPRIVDFSG
jgi:hypothetical protein